MSMKQEPPSGAPRDRQALSIARRRFFEGGELDENAVARVLSGVMSRSVDYADLYFQYSRHESWMLEEGRVKTASYNIEQGLGLRAVSGEKTGFACSGEFAPRALAAAADAVRAIDRQGGGSGAMVRPAPGATGTPVLYGADDPLASLDDRDKVRLLEQVEAEARKQDPAVKEVMAGLSAVQEVVLVVRNDGLLAADIRPLVRLNVTVIAERGGRREQGSAGGGGRHDLQALSGDGRALEYAREAVRQALINLEADDAPAGAMTVVLGPGWPGILLHEAIGHGLEGDFNRKNTSAFSGRIGERVASSQCTVVDNGTLERRRGSLNMDDEGTPTRNTVLIENGILKGYMQDTHNARLMGAASTGNGRRESFAHLPMPRMTNTYMLNGEHDPAEIIASVDKGLYAEQFGGGQVDITSGKFVFSASTAYLIEGGKVTRPVRGATLIGNGPDVLTRVAMVGNDLALDPGIGTCGKEGQSVPVGVGQPTLRVDALTVGGVKL